MSLEQRVVEVAGLRAIDIGPRDAALAVIVLHGREMCADDLAPFAHALGVTARFVVPDGPLPGMHRGRAWWPIDVEARARALQHGPLELANASPAGRDDARALIGRLRDAIAPPSARVALIGFSQGGMLAMDYTLHAGARPAALALLSSSRIAFSEWAPRLPALRDLPLLVTHGRDDAELAFAAGEGLRDAAMAGGARVTWLAFDGAHETPLVVWRAVRQLLRPLS
jgi:phospholipase/carboxylesterase